MSKRGIVIVISGPSGSGKGTVVKELRAICPTMQVSVSATTRQPREGEQNGVEYYFKTREEFEVSSNAVKSSNIPSTTAITTAR